MEEPFQPHTFMIIVLHNSDSFTFSSVLKSHTLYVSFPNCLQGVPTTVLCVVAFLVTVTTGQLFTNHRGREYISFLFPKKR